MDVHRHSSVLPRERQLERDAVPTFMGRNLAPDGHCVQVTAEKERTPVNPMRCNAPSPPS